MKQFKKLALVTAIAAFGAGNASALTLGDTGDSVLVPYVVCDQASSINTLVGLLTVAADREAQNRQPARLTSKGATRLIHWRFYNERSEHLLDGVIPASDNDFVRVDWCAVVQSSGQVERFSGQNGYMIFHDDSLYQGNAAPTARLKLSGHAYQVRGNWASQAFLPMVPANRANDGTGIGPDGYPRINNLNNGTSFDTATVNSNFRQIALRYFLDPALSTGTDFVFWFNRNNTNRARTPVEVFDSEQVYRFSDNAALGNELNIIRNTPTSVTFAGMNGGFDGDATNTGLVHFYVPTTTLATPATPNYRASGLAFGMVRLGAGSNPDQVQTELALEGQWLNGPF